ncbi:hypothetical protein CSUB01_00273 [Colletotrichum sublineola]|uniref:Uncharacterized protein n=1 Tax=Colletotrichum sublineola TaxID=1173701 RepID=A0A066XPV8_COLSU|nr:hypothetical protein CSUB01_00273 [Colletotrichum sublineola]
MFSPTSHAEQPDLNLSRTKQPTSTWQGEEAPDSHIKGKPFGARRPLVVHPPVIEQRESRDLHRRHRMPVREHGVAPLLEEPVRRREQVWRRRRVIQHRCVPRRSSRGSRLGRLRRFGAWRSPKRLLRTGLNESRLCREHAAHQRQQHSASIHRDGNVMR